MFLPLGSRASIDAAVDRTVAAEPNAYCSMATALSIQCMSVYFFSALLKSRPRKSLAITANTPFSQWGEVFIDAAMTLAAVDRLVNHATILEMNVESCRRRSARASQPARQRTRSMTSTAAEQG